MGTVNWYDVVVVGALLYGGWSGIRAGLTGEIIRVIGLILMVVLAVEFQEPLGNWINAHSSLPDEGAHLVAFVGIALAVYLVTLAIRLATRKQMQELKLGALLENVGGGFAGAIRMVVIMAWLTAILSLSSGEDLHSSVAGSRFGSIVMSHLPTWNRMIGSFPEKPWFMQDLKRRPEPNYETGGASNAPPQTIAK